MKGVIEVTLAAAASADYDGDGVLDQKPVSDILLGIRAYSRSGN